MSPDGLTAGQAGDGLVDHGLKDGGRQIFLGSALIDQGLYIGLGKHAAAGGDGIQGLVLFGIFVQAGGVRLDQGGHLVDKRACTTGTDAVHALFHVAALKVDDFGVLAAQFDGHIGFGSQFLQGSGYGDNLLGEGDAQVIGQGQSSGAGNHGIQQGVAQLFIGLLQQGGQRFPDIGIVTLIIGKENFVFII